VLFHSFAFLFAFLPAAWLGTRILAGWNRGAVAWLLACSLFFYAYWRTDHLWIILASIGGNFVFGHLIIRSRGRPRKLAFMAGVTLDLAVLGWFKYRDFAEAVINLGWQSLSGSYINPDLPIGISFFTFTQIAFLADCTRRAVTGYGLIEYGLFVTVFPHLLAGPIIHHGQVVPQFAALGRRLTGRLYAARWLAPGLALLLVGLIKKIVLGDSLGVYADDAFATAPDEVVGFVSAWGGVMAYSLQIYFDFSGYSDMAIGIGMLLGIRLPANFLSPYQAGSMIEFWRRWHITLSTFLRDYLYIPLGGGRCGSFRRYLNLLATMLLGGLWHGANWTFLAWGAIHGTALAINHGWHSLGAGRLPRGLGWGLTLAVVVAAWVPFRAPDLETTLRFWAAMIGANGIVLPAGLIAMLGPVAPALGMEGGAIGRFGGGGQVATVAVAALIALAAPNSMVLADRRRGPRLLRSRWLPLALGAGTALALLLIGVRTASTFLYFQF